MVKFRYAVHIHINAGMVPWYIATTSSMQPFEDSLISLSTVGLIFSYENAEYNFKMIDSFPRPNSIKLNYVVEKEDMEECLYGTYFWRSLRITVGILNICSDGSNYLLRIFYSVSDVILLDTKTVTEDLNLTAIFLNQFGIK